MQQRPRIWMLRLGQNRKHIGNFNNLPGIHNGYAVCHFRNNAQIVGDQDDARLAGILKLSN
ncbi:hypothetical protein D3C77_813900 [compost metagenome]